jgi:hypothetical protein
MGGYLRTIVDAVRRERKLRAYLAGSVVDDLGVAVSAWGMQLLTTNLFTDQRQRASLMMPTLLCFLLGCLVAGPLADWGARLFPEGLPARRWRLVVWARLVETAALGLAMWGVSGTPTVARLLPYFLISAFTKTALRPTRIAFEVDLLSEEAVQLDENGAQILDERGHPRMYKLHLLAFESLTSFLRSASVLGGLLLGGKILAAAGGNYRPLFAVDVATNLGFIAVVFLNCHPERDASSIRLRDLLGGDGPVHRSLQAGHSLLVESLREVGASFRDAARFLAGRDQRPLLWLLFGSLMVEVVNEFYDGKMFVKHVLHRSDDAVRYSDIAWTLTGTLAAILLPLLARRVGSLGKIFLATMLADGVVIVLAGRMAGASRLLPFVILLGGDKALTLGSGSLASLAQNSASSAAMRGRIAAAYALVVILADMGAEWAATDASEHLGLPGMLQWIGVVQVALMVLVALRGGRQLWRFGLRSSPG